MSSDIRILEQDKFDNELIELAQMVENGELNSTGARRVFHILYKRHLSRLKMIEAIERRKEFERVR